MFLTLQVLLMLVVDLSDLGWCVQSLYTVQYNVNQPGCQMDFHG
jgi:hypothetical protein